MINVQKLERLARDFQRHIRPLSHGHWQAYTPVWTAATDNPTAGHYTITGRYTRVGRTVIAVVTVILTDTGAGTGVYSFSLPVTAANTEVHVGGAYGYDASEAVKFYAGAVRLYTTTTMQIRGGGATGWASTVPFTWTTDDQIHMQLTYEAANVD